MPRKPEVRHPRLQRAADAVRTHKWAAAISVIGSIGTIVTAFLLFDGRYETKDEARREAVTNAIGRGYVQLRVLQGQKTTLDSQIFPLSFRKQSGEKLERIEELQLKNWNDELEDVKKQIDKTREAIAAAQGVK